MNETPLNQIIDVSLSKIGEVADVNTVIGDPITLPDGITIIPFSKVSVGFASGGADYSSKVPEAKDSTHFAGGNGAGLSVTPLGFIIINKGEVKVVDLKAPIAAAESSANNTVNKAFDSINAVVDKAPELFAKIKDKFSKKKGENAENADGLDNSELTKADEIGIEVKEESK